MVTHIHTCEEKEITLFDLTTVRCLGYWEKLFLQTISYFIVQPISWSLLGQVPVPELFFCRQRRHIDS